MKTDLFVVIAYVSVVFAYSPAGLYVDNGFDQTIIDRAMTEEEKREIELEILNLLGLPNRPRKSINAPLRKSAPKFLMDVYKSLLEKDAEKEDQRIERSSDLNLSGEEQNAIEESDVIMTFESTNDRVGGVRHERGKRLWFNVAEVPVENEVVGAELRIFQNGSHSSVVYLDETYVVTVYEVARSDKGERELEHVDSVNTTVGFMGWLELNLTRCFSKWLVFPELNTGLYLSVHPISRPGHELRSEDIGLITTKGDDETQPFMVAFLKATNHVKARSTREIRRIRKTTDYQTMMKNSASVAETVSAHEWRGCRIHTLYISFNNFKWQDWVIAPEGYAAYYCAGECDFPLNAHMNATNHAIVQSLMHLMNPTKYPKPCCAPTKLTPISVLHFADEINVILKKFKNMVVKSCGCH